MAFAPAQMPLREQLERHGARQGARLRARTRSPSRSAPSVCALVSDEGTVVTTTSSLVSMHVALCVVALLFGRLPLYEATQW